MNIGHLVSIGVKAKIVRIQQESRIEVFEMREDLFKIQKGDVYIQLPTDDSEAIQLAIEVLEWFKERIEKLNTLLES